MSIHCMLLGSRFKLRSNSRALGTTGSVIQSSGLSINGCVQSKKPFDERKQD